MFENYFKVGWRNILRQKMYSFIKVGGFALGIAACLLISLFIRDELSYDTQYPDGDRIYRVVGMKQDQDKTESGVHFPAPIAEVLREDYPEFEKVGRINPVELFGAGSKELRRADQETDTYEEGFVFADQDFIDILQVPMLYGNRTHVLDEPNTLLLARSVADRYFPNENPVGKAMIIDNDISRPFKVGGVMEDFPPTSHLHDYKILITLTGKEFWPGEQGNWLAWNYPTYVRVRNDANIADLERKMKKVYTDYILPAHQRYTKSTDDDSDKISFWLQPIRDIHLHSEGISDGLVHGDIRLVWLFGTIAAFILLLACINFVNLSTARSANRAVEVGLRKAVGSGRWDLVRQFLTESTLFSLFSFTLGIALAQGFLGYFNLLAGKHLIMPWSAPWFMSLLLAATLVMGLIAGIYPAIYLSAFKPVGVLKTGRSPGMSRSGLRSALVVFQFTTSIVLLIGTFVIYRQMGYILNKKLGFDKEQVLLLQGAGTLRDKIPTMKEELLSLAAVDHVSVSDYLPVAGSTRNGNTFWREGTVQTEQGAGVQIWRVDYDYVKTMGMQIIEGRDFARDMAGDSLGLIVNQSMAKALNLDDPIEARVTNNFQPAFHIIGVMEDFHFESLKENIRPLCLTLGNSPNVISVKIKSGDVGQVIGQITEVWNKFSATQPIRYTFLNERFARMYDGVKRTGRIFTSFSVLAIVVACLGLFALSAFMTEQRRKEISIRLVLGASIASILRLLTSNFVKLVLISLVIAIPVGWYLMQRWLENFAYRIDMEWDVFVLAGLLSLLIAVFTISFQSFKAAIMNPADNLRAE